MRSEITKKITIDLEASDGKGLQEYGVTVDRQDYTLQNWLAEAYEETLDNAKYLRAAIERQKHSINIPHSIIKTTYNDQELGALVRKLYKNTLT